MNAYASLEDAMAKRRCIIHELIGKAKSDKEREFWKLQLALTEPFSRWLHEAKRSIKTGDLAEVIGNAIAAIAREFSEQAWPDVRRALLVLTIEQIAHFAMDAPSEVVARVRPHDA